MYVMHPADPEKWKWKSDQPAELRGNGESVMDNICYEDQKVQYWETKLRNEERVKTLARAHDIVLFFLFVTMKGD